MIFGRTDLRRVVSKAKFDAESDFDVRLAVAPQKPDQNRKKLIFRSENFTKNFVLRIFGQVFEELRPNGLQNQIKRQILLQIHLS